MYQYKVDAVLRTPRRVPSFGIRIIFHHELPQRQPQRPIVPFCIHTIASATTPVLWIIFVGRIKWFRFVCFRNGR